MTNKHDKAPNAARRTFLRNTTALGAVVGTAGALTACKTSSPDVATNRTIPDGETISNPFKHGIATGDPTSKKIVFWTRLSQNVTAAPSATLKIYSDKDATTLVKSDTQRTSAGQDFTIKIDLELPEAYTTYYYQFECTLKGQTFKSQIGRTKTLPGMGNSGTLRDVQADTLPDGSADEKRLRLAVASCSSYAHGHFNAYARMAERNDLDVVLHLGDYIYDYQDGSYESPGGTHTYGDVRPYEPKHEIVTLDDYRNRHAHYKADSDLQELHRQHAMINIWDDHELVDNAYKCLAKNHNQDAKHRFADDGSEVTEGEDTGHASDVLLAWAQRARNAVQAYREWLPIRDALPEHGKADDDEFLAQYKESFATDAEFQLFQDISPIIFRSFEFSDFAKLYMLDTRFVGRDIEPEPNRNMGAFEVISTNPRHPILDKPISEDEHKCDASSTDVNAEAGRTDSEYPTQVASEHNLLGPTQREWFEYQFGEAHDQQTRWNIIGQQIMVGQLFLTNFGAADRAYFNPDQWDGYPAAKDWLHQQLRSDNGVYDADGGNRRNTVILTGDIHTSWAMDIVEDPGSTDLTVAATAEATNLGIPIPTAPIAVPSDYNKDTGEGSMAAEFICPSVTSPGLPDFNAAAGLLNSQNPHMHYIDLALKGYLLVDIRDSYVQCQWWSVGTIDDVRTSNSNHSLVKVFNATNHYFDITNSKVDHADGSLHVLEIALDGGVEADRPASQQADPAPFTEITA